MGQPLDRSQTTVPGPRAVNRQLSDPCGPAGREKSIDLAHALQANEQRLSRLLQDRDRMGRDLHDGVLQSVYAIGLSLETCRRIWRTAPKKSADQCVRAIAQVNRLIHEIRGLILRLESDSLKGFDLQTELQSLVDSYQGAGQTVIDLAVDPAAVSSLTLEESQQVAFIVREALSNSLRHGKAGRAAVSLRLAGGSVRMEIVDNGVGFRQRKTAYRGYGLTNMSARAQQLGGRVTVTSRPRRGTSVILTLPLNAASEVEA
jgi:signal transduction histidine kinase